MLRREVLSGAAALFWLGAPANAAVSICESQIQGKTAEAKSELEAKKAALDDWLQQAKKHGPEYTRWQIAFDRRIDCTKTAAGLYHCQAVGKPCAAKQVPPAPGSYTPLKRGS